MKNIAVVFGGKSVEHDISIITGLQVVSTLKEKYNIIPIYISRDGVWLTGDKLLLPDSFKNFCITKTWECYLKPHSKFLFIKKLLKTKIIKLDSIILCLHGVNGEDGSIQGFLDLTQIPYVSSGVLGSAVTMDKAVQKMLFLQNGIKTPRFLFFYENEYKTKKSKILEKIKKELGETVVVKPDRAGSSIGVKVCSSKKEIVEAIDLALYYDNKVIVEEKIDDFREINIACFGRNDEINLSCLEEVISSGGLLSFEQKYISSEETTRIVDVRLDEKTENEIKEIAQKAFYISELSGVCRMDFFVTKNGEVLLNEINSIPGSMANYLFKDISFFEMLEKLMQYGVNRFVERQNLTYLYKSDALLCFEKDYGKMKK